MYTPVAIVMFIGLFLLPKTTPYRRSVLVFCVLNIWIIIAWADWRYGASYSTRALVQSYPVFAFGIAAFLTRWTQKKRLQLLFPFVSLALTGLNFYQLEIYNRGILESFSPLLFGK